MFALCLSKCAVFSLITLSLLFANRQSDYFIVCSFIVLCGVLLFKSLSFFQKGGCARLNPLTALLLAWLGWNLFTLMVGWVSSSALFGLVHCSFWLLVYCLILELPTQQESELWWLCKRLLWSLAGLSALLACYQHYFVHAMAQGLFAARTTNGIFCAFAALLLYGELLLAKTTLRAYLQQALFFILNLALCLSFSRGVYLSYALGLFFLSYSARPYLRKQAFYKLWALMLGAWLFLLLTASQELAHRLQVLMQEQSRLVIWQGAWNLWRAISWYGLGLFNFKYYYKAFSLPADNSSLDYAHNDYLQLLLETGLPGFLILLAAGVYLLHLAGRYFEQPASEPQAHLALCSLWAVLLAFLCHSVVDYNFYLLPMNLLLGLILALLMRRLANETRVLVGFTLPHSKMLAVAGSLLLLLLALAASRLLFFTYYTETAERAKNKQEYELALRANQQALAWLKHPETHSRQADLYLEQAKVSRTEAEQRAYFSRAEQELAAALKQNNYYARAYFQLGLIQLLCYEQELKAQALFAKALRFDRHDSVLRFFYGQFLIQLQEVEQAKKLLHEGLAYPLAADIELAYLSLYDSL